MKGGGEREREPISRNLAGIASPSSHSHPHPRPGNSALDSEYLLRRLATFLSSGNQSEVRQMNVTYFLWQLLASQYLSCGASPLCCRLFSPNRVNKYTQTHRNGGMRSFYTPDSMKSTPSWLYGRGKGWGGEGVGWTLHTCKYVHAYGKIIAHAKIYPFLQEPSELKLTGEGKPGDTPAWEGGTAWVNTPGGWSD